MQSIRSALSASSRAALDRGDGQHLAEQDDVRLDLAAALGAGRDAVVAEQRLDLGERPGAAAGRAGGGRDRAVDLDQLAGARDAVQAVDVLGDHGLDLARASSSASATCAGFGCLSASISNRGR